MIKKIFIIIFIINSLFKTYSQTFIDEIIYKNVIIDYSQPVLITILLNNLNEKYKELIIYSNEKEVIPINYDLQDENISTITIEIYPESKEVPIQIIAILYNNKTLNYQTKLNFEKAVIFDNDQFIIKKHENFYITSLNENTDYRKTQLIIDNPSIIKFIANENKNDVIYHRLTALHPGITKIKLYTYDTIISRRNPTPYKVYTVTVKE